jgi:hypothetical protein
MLLTGLTDMQAVLALVPNAAVTNTAVHSGAWSQASTWLGGHIPAANANVLISTGVTVTLNTSTASLHTVRVDGTLQFATNINTALTVDTLVVSDCANLIIGMAAQPIAPTVHAVITFTDAAPINTSWDPTLISRGLIAMGSVTMYGAVTTPYDTLAQPAHAGATTLVLSQVPTGWHVGDHLIFPSTTIDNHDENLTILAISGNQVTVSPLQYDHLAPAAGLSVYIADLTRNVMLVSQNPADIAGRGHVMFMNGCAGTTGCPAQDNIYNVAFCDLGRTNKLIPVNDPQLDSQGHLIPGTGLNPRGRYAVHFHHMGVAANSTPAMVVGCVVEDSPGWGYVNHDSNVDFLNDVAYNVAGAGFVTEAGDEIGTFTGDLAIRSIGSGESMLSRQAIQDFGHQGDGFWLQGNGVTVNNDIAIGQADAGFVMYSKGLIVPGAGATTFLAADLANPAWAQGHTTVDVGAVPFRSFLNDQVYASTYGLHVRYSNPFAGTQSVIDGFTVWNTFVGAEIFYSNSILMRNSTFINGDPKGGGVAILEGNEGLDHTTYQNLTVVGWTVGINVSQQGSHTITGGYWNNVRSIGISSAFSANRNVTIGGNISFGTLSPAQLAGQQQYDIYLAADFDSVRQRDVSALFAPGTILYQGRQIYFLEQAANFIPLPQQASGTPLYPPQLLGLTNQQLWSRYGLAIGDALAPANATTSPRIHGLLGTPAVYPSAYQMASSRFSTQLQGYRLSYLPPGAIKGVTPPIVDPTPVNLQPGWNMITRRLGGHLQTFFVYGGQAPPIFVPDPSMVLVIHASQLSQGFTVVGKVDDPSGIAPVSFSQHFSNLTQLPIQRRADGSQYIVLTFTITDGTGGTAQESLQLTVVP